MQLKSGTVMIDVPTDGATPEECAVCTGPRGFAGREREMAQDAFIVGMVAGLKALREPRPRLCVEHETHLRRCLAVMGCNDTETLDRLGITYKIAGADRPTEPTRIASLEGALREAIGLLGGPFTSDEAREAARDRLRDVLAGSVGAAAADRGIRARFADLAWRLGLWSEQCVEESASDSGNTAERRSVAHGKASAYSSAAEEVEHVGNICWTDFKAERRGHFFR